MTTENNNPTAKPVTPIVAAPVQPKDDKSAAVSAEMQKSWDKLSPEDMKLYETSPDKFFGVLKDKQGVTRENAEKRLTEIKNSCGCGTEKAA